MSTPGCIVVDIDDTLYLERDYVRSGFRAVDAWIQSRSGAAGFFNSAWRAFEAGRRGDIFDYSLNELGTPVQAGTLAEMVVVYRTHVPDIALLPDARRFLKRVAPHTSLAVVSDGPLDSQSAKAAALGLSCWAEPIVLTAAYGADFHKPSSRSFAMIASRLGCEAVDCCYVADNPAKDFRGPKSLGWATIRIRRPGGLHCGVDSSDDVDCEFPSLDGVATWRAQTMPLQGKPTLGRPLQLAKGSGK